MLGKVASDLQEEVVIGNGKIEGTLHYVTDYTGFSGDPTEQEGHFLVFHAESNMPDSTITMELVNGRVGHPVTLDDDGIGIVHISDKDNQLLRIVATSKDGQFTDTKVYSLSELTLEPEG